jgi:eukaryotic-like serine/threonine-protein kinase
MHAIRLKDPDDWLGEELCGKWTLEQVIGLGGMAAVYAATESDGRRVAIKLMHRNMAGDDSVRQRFLREGYAANRVKHPAVISAFADGVAADGSPFLVMELVEGRGLDEILDEDGPFDADEVLELADQILDALAAAHERNILHRDLKPENLLLCDDGSVKLLDFGIARMNDIRDPRLTQTGRFMGTPWFMAPEQARGDWDNVDERTDIWGIGATMFALITGREVHVGTNVNDVLVSVITKPPPKVRDVAPHVSAGLAAIVDGALFFDKQQRWPSARAMQRAVRRLKGMTSGRSDSPPPLAVDDSADTLMQSIAPVARSSIVEKEVIAPALPVKRSLWRLGAAMVVGVLLAGSAGADELGGVQRVQAMLTKPHRLATAVAAVSDDLAVRAGAVMEATLEVLAWRAEAERIEAERIEAERIAAEKAAAEAAAAEAAAEAQAADADVIVTVETPRGAVIDLDAE